MSLWSLRYKCYVTFITMWLYTPKSRERRDCTCIKSITLCCVDSLYILVLLYTCITIYMLNYFYYIKPYLSWMTVLDGALLWYTTVHFNWILIINTSFGEVSQISQKPITHERDFITLLNIDHSVLLILFKSIDWINEWMFQLFKRIIIYYTVQLSTPYMQ